MCWVTFSRTCADRHCLLFSTNYVNVTEEATMAEAPAGLVPPKFNIDQPRFKQILKKMLLKLNWVQMGPEHLLGESASVFHNNQHLEPLCHPRSTRPSKGWRSSCPTYNQSWFPRTLWRNTEKENWITCLKTRSGRQNTCTTQLTILIQVRLSHQICLCIFWIYYSE